jgi:hypothetical protein
MPIFFSSLLLPFRFPLPALCIPFVNKRRWEIQRYTHTHSYI